MALTLISLSYIMGGEKVFKSLRPSYCENLTADGKKAVFSGKIYKKEHKGKSWFLYLKEVEIESKSVCDEKIIVSISDKSTEIQETGKRISGRGEAVFLVQSRNPGNFNQKLYYQKQNIQLQIKDVIILNVTGSTDFLKDRLFSVRRSLSEFIYKTVGEERGGVLSAMLLGERDMTDEEIKEYYQKSGIGHLLAISGLHISFLGMGLLKILRKCGCSVKISALISIFILGIYAYMTGWGISVTRAYVMFVVRMGALILGREYDGLTALSTAAMVLAAENPLNITQPAFLLSFGAVFGIYGLYPLMESFWKKKKGEKIRKTIALMFAVRAVLMPVMLFNFYELNPYSLVWNLLAVPLASVVMGFGMTGVILAGGMSFFKLPIGIPVLLIKSASVILGFYDKVSRLIMELPCAHIIVGKPSFIRIGIYYCLTAVFFFCIYNHTDFRKKTGMILLAVMVLMIPEYRSKRLEITMIDIGQGDCFFMRTPEGTTHLIDGGSSTMIDPAKNAIEPFLKSMGISAIDYVWISHGDMDHVNGIEEMIERQKIGVKIRRVIMIPEEFWDERLVNVYRMADKMKIPVYTTERGKVWKENGLSLTCLWPLRQDHEYESNEGSMVLSLNYGRFDMLFTGDLERRGEEKVTAYIRAEQKKGSLPEKYDVLKVGHHGSKFGTGDELLECTAPTEALISSGRKNRYGHPHQEVIERLAKRKARIYNTKDRHAVNLYTDGKKYCILIP